MSEKIRLGVIGAGHLGRIHAKLARQVEEVELVAVVDPSPEARRLCEADGSTPVLSDYHDLLGKLDAAIVATPTRFHHAVSLDLLERGIHLLVEKPLATSVAEADEMLEVATRRGAILQVGHIERFNPAWNQPAVAPLVREPKYIEASRCSGFTFRSTDIGVVLDLMIHDLDLILYFANSPVQHVQALGISVMGHNEDVAQARLEFANGCVANVSASRVSYKPQRVMQVWSEHGCVSLDFATRSAITVHPVNEIVQREFDLDDINPETRDHLKTHLFEDLLQLERHEAKEQNALLDEIQDFADCVRHSRTPKVTGRQGRDVLAVAERILQSIDLHCWDGNRGGRVGPHAAPAIPILRGPHWPRKAADAPERRREAG
jgi:predicted dehydrogenase